MGGICRRRHVTARKLVFALRARLDAREILEQWQAPEWKPLRARIEPRVKSRYERFAGG